MKIAIDTFGCDHAKSGWGSYLFYFVKNIPADSKFKHQYELFGAEIDRYTYTSDVEKTYLSVDINDDLKRDYIYKYIKNLRAKMSTDLLANADNGGFKLN